MTNIKKLTLTLFSTVLLIAGLPCYVFAGDATQGVTEGGQTGNSEEEAISTEENASAETDGAVAADEAPAPLTSAEVPGTIANGVTIAGTDVSGMNFDEAKAAAEQYASQFANVNFTVKAGDLSVNATGADFGIGARADEVCRLAVLYGKTGNPLERYIAGKKCDAGQAVDFSIPLVADSEAVSTFLTNNQSALSVPVVNNGLKRENGQFVFIAGNDGVSIDVASSAAKITNFVDSEWDGSDSTIELDTTTVEPEGSEEQLRAIQDNLGTFSTNYSTSGASRKQNIKVATANINGSVVYPGETFSTSTTMKSRTLENGYAIAAAYENGTTVDSVGGGVCQVSSTLYNAVIRAELEIVERSPHSMKVAYVKPSDDAAIADGIKDFVFKNNQDYPIYIEGITTGTVVSFTIYGKETRPANRKVSFESEILETTDPGNEFHLDGTLAVGTVTRTSAAHQGIKAQLLKIVTVDGQEQSRDVFNKSTYRMTNNIYSVGTAGATPEGLAAINAAVATGDVEAVKAAATSAAAAAAGRTPAADPNAAGQTPAAGAETTPGANTTPAENTTPTAPAENTTPAQPTTPTENTNTTPAESTTPVADTTGAGGN